MLQEERENFLMLDSKTCKSSNLMKASNCTKNTTFNEAKKNILLSGDVQLSPAWGGNYVYISLRTADVFPVVPPEIRLLFAGYVYIHFYTNPKPENRQKKAPTSAVNNTVNKLILDRRSCEKLHQKLGLPTRFS